MKNFGIYGLLLFFGIIPFNLFGDNNKVRPKLVVGIVIDQMRYDYLYRYYDQLSNNGFKRLMNQGKNFTYAHYNYIPTYTGPGHSSIYTGTTPYYHGIISNDWYDRHSRKVIYCVSDTGCRTIGANDASGEESPKNLLATTITDQLRMSNNGLSRVFSVSIKDRAAILPGGHMANAAYWYDGKSGNFVTSSYYLHELPGWVKNFNSQQLPKKLMTTGWSLSLPESNYESALPDAGPGESDVFNEGKTTFPHSFGKLTDKDKLEKIASTPFGNELLADFVEELLNNEKIGNENYTDFLAVSFSSTDYVGHAYGPNSMEIMDTYIKLDLQIERLLNTLDKTVGQGNYLLFLTADHGVRPNGAYLRANRLGTVGTIDKTIDRSLRDFCKHRFGNPQIIDTVEDNQIYLKYSVIQRDTNLNYHMVTQELINYLRSTYPELTAIYSKEDFNAKTPTRSMYTFMLNGSNPSRSGDLSFELTMNYLTEPVSNGTTHGVSFDYDTHVPLLFYGWHIEQGESAAEVYIEDIAPTVANLIHIQEPDGTIGVPIIQVSGKP